MNAKRGKISGGWHWSPKHVTMDSLDSDWSRQKSTFSDWREQLKVHYSEWKLERKKCRQIFQLEKFFTSQATS